MHEPPEYEFSPPPDLPEDIEAQAAPYGWLHESPADYLSLVHRGTVVVQGVIIVQLLMGLCYGALVPGLTSAGITLPAWVDMATTAVGFVLSCLLICGWWMLTSPSTESMSRSRRWVRALVVFSAVALGVRTTLLFMGGGSIGPNGIPNFSRPLDIAFWSVMALESLVSLAAYFPQLLYLAWLARGVPDEPMRRRAMLLLWLGPLLMTVGLVLLGLGPLIALVLYWNLLDKFRKVFKSIRAGHGRLDASGMDLA